MRCGAAPCRKRFGPFGKRCVTLALSWIWLHVMCTDKHAWLLIKLASSFFWVFFLWLLTRLHSLSPNYSIISQLRQIFPQTLTGNYSYFWTWSRGCLIDVVHCQISWKVHIIHAIFRECFEWFYLICCLTYLHLWGNFTQPVVLLLGYSGRKGGTSVTSQYLLGNRARIDCVGYLVIFYACGFCRPWGFISHAGAYDCFLPCMNLKRVRREDQLPDRGHDGRATKQLIIGHLVWWWMKGWHPCNVPP